MGFIFYTSTKKDHNSTSFSFKNAIDLIGTAFLRMYNCRNVPKILTRKNRKKTMRNILYIVAVILIIGWLLGVFAYSVGGIIHILLVLAVVSILLSLIRRGV